MIDFQTFLASRGIDCQELGPELLAALQSQFERECRRLEPVSEKLVIPSDCLHPLRVYRVSTQPLLFNLSPEYQ